jgi:hypothetical protein
MGNDQIMNQTTKNFEEVSFVEKASAHKHKILKPRFASKDN